MENGKRTDERLARERAEAGSRPPRRQDGTAQNPRQQKPTDRPSGTAQNHRPQRPTDRPSGTAQNPRPQRPTDRPSGSAQNPRQQRPTDRPSDTRESGSRRAPIRTPKKRSRLSSVIAEIKQSIASLKQRRRAPYKSGALAHSRRPIRTEGRRAPLIITLCVLVTLLFSIILGNALSSKAHHSQTTTIPPSGGASSFTPSVDKTSPTVKLHAYFANMSGADPENSLSEQTGTARDSGNALFFELRYANGDLLYSSDLSDELDYPARTNLTLSRLSNHLAYYSDYAVGAFVSDYSPNLGASERLEIKSREASLLAEAADECFSQLIVEFSDTPSRDTLLYYQSYLIDLKLACPSTPIGIKMSYSFISDSDNSGTVSGLLSVCDFFVLELGTLGAEEIENALSPLVYYIERYDGTVMISSEGGSVEDRVAALEKKKIENYIVK